MSLLVLLFFTSSFVVAVEGINCLILAFSPCTRVCVCVVGYRDTGNANALH